jgi:hypothetical protein
MNKNLKYRVDICIGIDLSKSMQYFLNVLKAGLLNNILIDIKNEMLLLDKTVDVLRVKFIGFSYQGNSIFPYLNESPFFVYPGQEEELNHFLLNLEIVKSNEKETPGLEAIELAIKSKWTDYGNRQKHLIIIYSNNECFYSVENFNLLTDLWDGQDYMSNRSAKRLLIFAPDSNAWTDIATHWDNTVHYPSRAGDGLAEVDYQTILSAIVNSI